MKKLFILPFLFITLGSCTSVTYENISYALKEVNFKQAIEKLLTEVFQESQSLERIDIANSYVDLHEERDNAKLKEFLGIDPAKTEWCAAFVNAVLEKQGIEGTNSLAARSFVNWGKKVDEPSYGDIVVFPRNGGQSWQGHVGFYIDTYVENNKTYYIIIGGNQNDEVNISEYLAKEAISIRRPPLGKVK